MKKVEYLCNLCNEKTAKEDLKTMYYKSDTTPQRYVILNGELDKSDKHICIKCISLIKSSV
jgi:hypothetical protein